MTFEFLAGLIGIALIVLGACLLLISQKLAGMLFVFAGIILAFIYLPIVAIFGSLLWAVIWICCGILVLAILYRIFFR